MKRSPMIALLLCLAALLTFTACDAGEPPASNTPPQDSSAQDSSEPETDPAAQTDYSAFEEVFSGDMVYESLEDFLPLAQIELYWAARAAYLDNMGPDWTDEPRIGFTYGGSDLPTVERDGVYYTQLDGEFATLEELKAYFYGIFTPEYADELMGLGTNFERYIEVDGKLYGMFGDRGTHIDWNGAPDLYGPASVHPGEDGLERMEFTVVGQYEARDTGEPYTESYPIVMVHTEDGWRVDAFSITY